MVSTAAFHARARGSVPGLGGLKETKLFLPHPRVKVSIMGSLRDREVACSASDRQGSNFISCVWRTVSSQSSHHPQEVLLAQFSLYVHKGGLKPDSFHFISILSNLNIFHPLQVVDRVSETQLEVGEKSNCIIWRLKDSSWNTVCDAGAALNQHWGSTSSVSWEKNIRITYIIYIMQNYSVKISEMHTQANYQFRLAKSFLFIFSLTILLWNWWW